MSDDGRLTPLGYRAAIAAGEESAVAMSEVADRAMIDIRARRVDKAAFEAIEKALGLALPEAPRTSAQADEVTALWLSVDQWLVIVPLAQRAALVARLAGAAQGQFAAVTDMSDARAVIRLAGDGAREVVMKGGAADLTTCDAGTVRRLRLAEIAAMVHIVSTGPDVLDVYVFRSYADYAWDWLARAGRASAALRLFAAQPAPTV